jgi:TonB family protein
MLEGGVDDGGEPQQTRVGGVRGGARVVERRGAEEGPAVREVEQTPETMVFFERAAGAPVAITEARMRLITREQLRRADEEGADSFDEEEAPLFVTLPTVTLVNVSGKAVREVGVGFVTGGRLNVVAGYALPMRPGESQTVRSDWRRRNVIIPGTLADVSLRVVWVTFVDGTQWGARLRDPHMPPPPPSAPDAPPPPPPGSAVRSATAVSVEGAFGGVSMGDRAVSGLGGRAGAAAGLGVGSGAGGGVGSAVGGGTGAGASAGFGVGDNSGARAGGGSGGARAGGAGGLGSQKLYAPRPEYPPIAKAAGAEGSVSVRITVDEEGNVVAAEAVSGHPLLRTAAVDAARASKFKPTVIDGQPAKVSGIISYVFTLK